MIDRQDELVDEVGHTVGRLKEYAHQINDELESQEQYAGGTTGVQPGRRVSLTSGTVHFRCCRRR